MTKKIIALCLLILIPVTLNCMASTNLVSDWAFAMGRGRMGQYYVLGFSLAAAVTCAPFMLVGSIACSAAAAV